MSDGSFSLTKWYFDGVSADGSAFIAHWTSVAWRALAVTWQDLWVFAPDGTASHRSSLAGGTPPEAGQTGVLWQSAPLETEMRVHPTAAPVRERLLDSEQGYVDWHVVAPAARVSARLGGRSPMDACGYAEVIRMTIPPWRLPIRELRWGRWMDADMRHAMVWVEWRGDRPGTWVYWNARREHDGVVTDELVSTSQGTLALVPRRTLHDRRFAEVLDGLPVLKHAVPASVLGLRQTKWLSTGELRDGDATVVGSAIHEVVVFR